MPKIPPRKQVKIPPPDDLEPLTLVDVVRAMEQLRAELYNTTHKLAGLTWQLECHGIKDPEPIVSLTDDIPF